MVVVTMRSLRKPLETTVAIAMMLVALGVVFYIFTNGFDAFREFHDFRPAHRDAFAFALGPGDTFVHATRDSTFTGAPSQWYELTIRSQEVAVCKRAVLSHYSEARTRGNRYVDKEVQGQLSFLTGGHDPSWWKPASLPHPQAVVIGPYPRIAYIFSEEAGTIYVWVSGH
jgi:hypothetical protein